VRGLIAALVVPTGQVLWHLGPTRPREDCTAHLADAHRHLPALARYAWGVDPLTTHWSLEVCRLVATWCHLPLAPQTLLRGVQRSTFLSDPTQKQVFHCTPTQGAWLKQVEWWWSVLARRCLKRGDCSALEDCTTRLLDDLDVYKTQHAHPYRWTSTGQPLVRAPPCNQTRRQQQQGRAWFSPRPHCFDRALYPPRPYKRATTQLTMNL
jgi:hypothetical protein